MGKNFTLYINQERFSAEQNKSGLVNELLAEHYTHHPYDTGAAGSPLQPEINKIIKSKEDVIPAIKKVFPEAKVEPLWRDKKNKRL